MKSDPKRLLDDMLDEAAPADFRSAVLEQTLRRVRRRRIGRHVQRGLVAMALLIALPLAMWRTIFFSSRDHQSAFPRITVVSTQPISPAALVESKPGGASIVASSLGEIVVVETGMARDTLKEITDDELLALVAGRPAVLVRQSPHQAELLFVNADDQNGFPVQ